MAGEALLFPSLEWFEAVRALVNEDAAFRNLGSIDTQMGVKSGSDIFVITFEAFKCTEVSAGTDDDLFELDFYLDMPPETWQDMLTNIKENGAADHQHTLNTLDLRLPDGLSANATGDQFKADMFFRFNESLQQFFNLSAQLETVFRDEVTSE
jgi:hypothetical protein